MPATKQQPMEPTARQSGPTRLDLCLYAGAALFAIMAPLLLIRINIPMIRLMDAVYHPIPLLQLFVFTASMALIGVLGWTMWRQRNGSLHDILPFLVGILVSFHFLSLLRQHATRSWDYACYERAAQAIVTGVNPYGDCYIYFPTPAQALAALHQFGLWGLTWMGRGLPSDANTLWDLVFYFYESTQFLLVTLAFALCYRLATALGIKQLYAAIFVATLFLINNPLLATLKHNQVNLWVLDLLLVAILALPRYPILSGICVALGGHIKLYPLALLLPWGLARRWWALGSTGITLVSIFLLQTGGGRNLTLWAQFLDFADTFPRGTFLRDNSLHSLVYNSLGSLKWLLSGTFTVNERYISLSVLFGMALFGTLYLVRFWQRSRLQNDAGQSEQHLFFSTEHEALLGHIFDAIALALIVSPVVWEHHYLLIMPVVIWAVARAQSQRQFWLIGISTFLIFAMPTFDLFPFSYHRLLGLLVLMVAVSPAYVPNWGATNQWLGKSDQPADLNQATAPAVITGMTQP